VSNWTVITSGALNASSSSGKVAQIRELAAKRNMPDPAPAAIANITNELRAAIGFSGKYTVDANLSALPAGLIDLATKKIVRDMARVVNFPLTDDEKTDERTYEARLDKIRLGQWPIDPADTPLTTAPVQDSVVVPVTKPRPRQFDRSTSY
jgi:hypothetical protein